MDALLCVVSRIEDLLNTKLDRILKVVEDLLNAKLEQILKDMEDKKAKDRKSKEATKELAGYLVLGRDGLPSPEMNPKVHYVFKDLGDAMSIVRVGETIFPVRILVGDPIRSKVGRPL